MPPADPFAEWGRPPAIAPPSPAANPADPFAEWPRPAAPEVKSDAPSNLYAEETERPSTALIDLTGAGRTAKGVAKTLTGFGVGAGQVFAGDDPTSALNRLGATAPAQGIKNWAMSPATSIAEEEGKVLPYLVGGPARGLLGLAKRAGQGAMIAGFSPTQSGSQESHEENAKWGTGLAAALGAMGVPAAAIRSSSTVRHALGHAINAAIGETISKMIGGSHYGLLYGLHHGGIGYQLAKYIPEMLNAARKVPPGVSAKVATERPGRQENTANAQTP